MGNRLTSIIFAIFGALMMSAVSISASRAWVPNHNPALELFSIISTFVLVFGFALWLDYRKSEGFIKAAHDETVKWASAERDMRMSINGLKNQITYLKKSYFHAMMFLVGKTKFRIGDPVCKPQGYSYPGIVKGIFFTSTGDIRYVVELDVEEAGGLFHIFNEQQLDHRTVNSGDI